ncbi:unnamed protein product, partial [marine sediment metagenome]
MSLESPISYADWYWKHSVDAQKTFSEDAEKELAPYIAGILADAELPPETPAGVKNFIAALSSPPSFSFISTMAGVGLNAVDEVLDLVFDPILTMMKRANKRRTKETWLTSSQANTLWARQKITEGLWDESVASEGYEDVLASA